MRSAVCILPWALWPPPTMFREVRLVVGCDGLEKLLLGEDEVAIGLVFAVT